MMEEGEKERIKPTINSGRVKTDSKNKKSVQNHLCLRSPDTVSLLNPLWRQTDISFAHYVKSRISNAID